MFEQLYFSKRELCGRSESDPPATCKGFGQILVVEDEPRLAREIVAALIEAGHDPTVVYDSESALNATTQASFDLIVLDLTLSHVDGLEVLRRLRSQHITSRVPMLSAHGDVDDCVTGLDLGADDCVPKPFVMQELVAWVNALGRRYPAEPMLKLRVGDLELDLVGHQAYRDSHRVELSARELMLLKTFFREPRRVFTRTELCERIWGRAHEYDSKLVDVSIARLRKKIGEPPLVHTVRHVGHTVREAIIDAGGVALGIGKSWTLMNTPCGVAQFNGTTSPSDGTVVAVGQGTNNSAVIVQD